MQYIVHEKHLNSLFKEFEKLYIYTSDLKHATTLLQSSYSLCFKSLIDLFSKHSKASYNVKYKRTEYKHIVPKKSRLTNNGRIILCYSGGKDSTATAIRLKNEGWDIVLYHLRGINQTYRDEYMRKLALEYPQYGWDRNMGYPTPEHVQAIIEHGYTPHHRKSFHLKQLEPTLF